MIGMVHRFAASLLREYDVRGVVGDTLSEADALALGRSFGTMVRAKGGRTVCLGYDGRPASPAFADAVSRGLMATGVDVVRTGLGPTPMLYYAVNALDADGGVMVTASHNPPEYNGFKLMIGKDPFYGEMIQEMARIAASGDYADGRGSEREEPMLERYVARIAQDFRGDRPLTVAWDAGNGAAGEAMVKLAAALPGRHILLCEEIDGSFPNHHPDPTLPENLVQLQEAVRANNAEVGLALDGDGDRIGVVDGEGEILWADQVMILLAREILEERPGATIIADVKASQTLFDEIARLGGKPLMWRTGHSLIKTKLKDTKSPLAGEMSGHIFYADRYYGYDDALYTAVRLLGILSRSARSLADMRREMPKVLNTPELRFPCADDAKQRTIGTIKERLAARGAEVNDIDGVRVLTDDGWWLLRASNTQDVLVARCESATEAGLARLKSAVREQLETSGLDVPDF